MQANDQDLPKAKALLLECQSLITRLAAFGTAVALSEEDEKLLWRYHHTLDQHGHVLLARARKEAGLSEGQHRLLYGCYQSWRTQHVVGQRQERLKQDEKRSQVNAYRRPSSPTSANL